MTPSEICEACGGGCDAVGSPWDGIRRQDMLQRRSGKDTVSDRWEYGARQPGAPGRLFPLSFFSFFCFLAVILFCFHSGTVLFGSDSFPGQVGVLTNTKQSFFSHEALALAHVIGPRPEFRALVGSREGLTMLLRAGYGHGNVEEGGAGMMGGSGKRRHTRGMFGRGSSEAGNERDLWRGHVLGPVE